MTLWYHFPVCHSLQKMVCFNHASQLPGRLSWIFFLSPSGKDTGLCISTGGIHFPIVLTTLQRGTEFKMHLYPLHFLEASLGRSPLSLLIFIDPIPDPIFS